MLAVSEMCMLCLYSRQVDAALFQPIMTRLGCGFLLPRCCVERSEHDSDSSAVVPTEDELQNLLSVLMCQLSFGCVYVQALNVERNVSAKLRADMQQVVNQLAKSQVLSHLAHAASTSICRVSRRTLLRQLCPLHGSLSLFGNREGVSTGRPHCDVTSLMGTLPSTRVHLGPSYYLCAFQISATPHPSQAAHTALWDRMTKYDKAVKQYEKDVKQVRPG